MGECMKYYVLGPLEFVTAAGPSRIRGKRTRALLAILLMYPGQVVPVERIVDDMWPDNPPRSAVENVRTYVHQLRSLLGSGSGRSVLESHPGGYRLVVEPEDLDMTRFLRLANEGRRAHQLGHHEAAAALLGEALGLWRGAPLSGLHLSRTMRAKTLALKEHWWQAQVDWFSVRLALGESGELVAPLRELIGERPLDEGLRCLLVTALALSGRTGAALAAIDEARDTFVQELGIEPGPELRRLQTGMLHGEEVIGPPRPNHGPCPVCTVAPHQLPREPPDFVDREDALSAIETLAARVASGAVEHVPVVLVSGLPGVGKTAMAVSAARRILARLPEGELYIDLRGMTESPVDPAEAMGIALGAFGIAQDALPDGAENRRSLFRSLLFERRMLVLLDNASDPHQVLPLIPGPGRSLVMVVSRRRLPRVQADLRLSPGPLTSDAALEMLGNMIGRERLDNEPAAARHIAEACGRLPSAIEIAAARLSARSGHPLEVLANRLDDRVLDELSFGGTSIRATFETSYRFLDLGARLCFRALGLFPTGPITAVAVGQAIGMPPHATDRQLEGLVSEGLLNTAVTAGGTPTFWLPTVLHAYARERLEYEGLRQPPPNGVADHTAEVSATYRARIRSQHAGPVSRTAS